MLVITIIVIIILAVAVILTLSNNNPITNAKKAVSTNDESVKKEAATIAYADWYLKENTGESTGVKAQQYVEDALEVQGIDSTGLLVSNDGKIVTNAPIIPNGFKYLTGTVETGLVIKNTTDSNEFVWVPVDVPEGKIFEEVFVRESFTETELDTTKYIEPYEEEGYTSEREEYDAMVASVKKYGGFYIARYEASKKTVDGVSIIQSIANQQPSNSLFLGGSMTDVESGVIKEARAVYPDSSTKTTGDVVSTLPYGVQWDATLRFILTNYPEEILTDSSDYGYYTDGLDPQPIPTGSNDKYKLNNIYDMAGNYFEWTMECNSNNGRVARGGFCYESGSSAPISIRLDGNHSDGGDYVCTRLALYIK